MTSVSLLNDRPPHLTTGSICCECNALTSGCLLNGTGSERVVLKGFLDAAEPTALDEANLIF